MVNRFLYTSLFLVIFFTIVFLILLGVSRSLSPAQKVEKIEQVIQRSIGQCDSISDQIRSELIKDGNINLDGKLARTDISTLVLKDDKLIFWSDNRIDMSTPGMFADERYIIADNGGNKYLLVTERFYFQQQTVRIVNTILIYRKSFVENQFIASGPNKKIFKNIQFSLGYSADKDFYPVSYKGNVLFYISFPAEIKGVEATKSILWLCLVLFGIALILSGGYFIANEISIRENFRLIIFIFGIVLIGARSGLLWIDFPFAYFNFKLFDAKWFASSIVNPSLGDLLMNVLLILVFLSFAVLMNKRMKNEGKAGLIRNRNYLWQFVLILSTFGFSIFLYEIAYGLSAFSQWDMDITNSIDFSFFKVLSFIILLLIVAEYFLLNITVLTFLSNQVDSKKRLNSAYFMLLGILCIILVILYLDTRHGVVLLAHLFFFLFSIFFRFYLAPSSINLRTYLHLVITAVFASSTVGYAISISSFEQAVLQKKRYANQIMIENDVLAEFLLKETSKAIERDVFILNRFLVPLVSQSLIEAKVKRFHLPTYFNKYEFHLIMYDVNGYPITPLRGLRNYFELKKDMDSAGYQSGYENIYYMPNKSGIRSRQYLCFIPILRQGYNIGYILIDLKSPDQDNPNFASGLLVNEGEDPATTFQRFDYAFYHNQKMVVYKGEYNYNKYFDIGLLKDARIYKSGISHDGFHHLAVGSLSGNLIVVSGEFDLLKHIYSNFSFFLFISVLCVILILLFLSVLNFFRGKALDFSTKIQFYLSMYFLIPLIVLSTVTVSFLSNSYRIDLNNSYLRRAEIIANDFAYSYSEYQLARISFTDLENRFNKIAGNSNCDLNLYDKSGRLLLTTQPDLYRFNLMTELIHPVAYHDILEYDTRNLLVEEKIGKLNYTSAYLPIKSTLDGSLLGIISVPFFGSQVDLSNDLINALTTVINVAIAIFLGFIIISFLVTSNLIAPLRVIAQSLKRTSLTGNVPLSWPAKDEIGTLVNEYNKMIQNLEESREILAKTEKETAWREMARQIAHEIKNPLTPMKLKLQHLEMTWRNSTGELKDETIGTVQALLGQIKNLDEIASSFMDFAKMPEPVNELYNLEEVLRNTITLYDHPENVEIKLVIEKGNYQVKGDEKMISRILTNLILNAIQATPENIRPEINLKLFIKGNNKAILTVSDNGAGIPKENQDKIFEPNFSTKYYGSGIGLSIVKRGVEYSGGTITFESKEQEGATFIIELPLVT